MGLTKQSRTKSKFNKPRPMATCYACGTERAVTEFLYKEKAKSTSTSIFKRWLRPRKPTQPTETTVASKYQYRCVHPSAGSCPRFKTSTSSQRCHETAPDSKNQQTHPEATKSSQTFPLSMYHQKIAAAKQKPETTRSSYSPPSQSRPSNAQPLPLPTPAQPQQRPSQPKPNTPQPKIMPTVSSTMEENDAGRKQSSWQERDDMYVSRSGFVLRKYKEPPKYSEQWFRDNDLW